MRKLHVLALAAALPLAACGRHDTPAATAATTDATAAATSDTALGRKIQAAMAKASEKLAQENISVGGRINGVHWGGYSNGSSHLPKAEISPQGDFLVDGKPVPVDEAQRKLLLEHRANLVAIAQAGIAVGMRGADLGVKAATGALKNVFSGNSDAFGKEMEAEGKRIEAEARQLCLGMPRLLASQQALAATLPAFKPYATMEQSDVDDCGKDDNFDFGGDDADTTAASDGAAADAPEAHVTDAAAEADAAAKGSSRQ